MLIERKSPINETNKKRYKFFLCKGFEKLHRVFIKYENRVATIKATPLASDGVINIKEIKIVAISTCIPVTNNPDIAKRKTFIVNKLLSII